MATGGFDPNETREKKRVSEPAVNLSTHEETQISLLSEIFPNTDIDYIKQLYQSKHWNLFEEVVDAILGDPNRPEQSKRHTYIFKTVQEILPDADPLFLKNQCEKLNYDLKLLTRFVEECRDHRNYPTLKDTLREQQLSAKKRQYTENFDIEEFLKEFPDPEKTFSDPKRKIDLDEKSMQYIFVFFFNKFNTLRKVTIRSVLRSNNFDILCTNTILQDLLEKKSQNMKTVRKPEPIQITEPNVLILQKMAYITHKEEIERFVRKKEKQIAENRRNAKDNGLMKSCSCCFNDEVMPEDIFCCPQEHPFCRECIETSCGIALGEGRTEIKCLAECTEDFRLSTLEKILPPKMFSNLTRKQALAEIKAAGLDDLEACPFCDFLIILNPHDKVFQCLNPECMKESCRECKELSHIPLRCNEVEKDEQVKARTHIENKMTEALLRKCWKCGTSFFKEDGCNKMKCPCGAAMCYVCSKPVEAYEHFNGIGGDKINLCPLYSDTNEFNKNKVVQAAIVAKQEVASELIVDPTVDIEQHFEERRQIMGVPDYVNLLREQRDNLLRIQELLDQQLQARRDEMNQPAEQLAVPPQEPPVNRGAIIPRPPREQARRDQMNQPAEQLAVPPQEPPVNRGAIPRPPREQARRDQMNQPAEQLAVPPQEPPVNRRAIIPRPPRKQARRDQMNQPAQQLAVPPQEPPVNRRASIPRPPRKQARRDQMNQPAEQLAVPPQEPPVNRGAIIPRPPREQARRDQINQPAEQLAVPPQELLRYGVTLITHRPRQN